MKRLLSILVAAALLLTMIPTAAFAAGEPADHVLINQVYGASKDGYASHSFIELYNPAAQAADLSGWSVQYKSSQDGAHNGQWYVLTLTGTIPAKGYYLIRCGAATDTKNVKYQVPAGDQEWDQMLHNKGLSVVLMRNSTQLTDSFAGDITAAEFVKPDGFVDLAAVQGNDGEEAQIPPAYEGGYLPAQSKKKAIRRINFRDTDSSADDFAVIDYSGTVSEDLGPHTSQSKQPQRPDPVPSYTPAVCGNGKYYGSMNQTAELQAELIARYNSGAASADGGSAEITAYNPVNHFAYTVNGVKGTLDCIDMSSLTNGETAAALNGTEVKAVDLAASVRDGFTYGDMTSAAVSPDGTLLAVSMQDKDFTKTGRVLVFQCEADGSLTFRGSAVTGVQPDMTTFSEDGAYILTADEGEPRDGYGPGAIDPKGSVTVIDTGDLANPVTADFTAFDTDEARAGLTAKGIVLKKNTAPSVDLEPEYITVCGQKAYVALQEANAVAVLDLKSRTFEDIWSIGFEDHSRVAVDLNKEDKSYQPSTYENLKGIRMADGIAACRIGGQTYLLTANEGDSRAWPVGTEEYSNEVKSKTSPVTGIKTGGKVTWFDAAQYDGLEANTDYIFGGRSFTVFRVTDSGLEEVFDSGSDFERITAQIYPDHFNCSNDTVEAEDRSGKKGPEPENVTVGTVGNKIYACVGLERIGGVMLYDISDPRNSSFENYINSRDFSAAIQDDVSPEGILFVGAAGSVTGKPLVIASNEVSGTVSVIELTQKQTSPGGTYIPSRPAAEDKTPDTDPDKDGQSKTDEELQQETIAKTAAAMKLTARSARTAKKNVRVVLKTDAATGKALAALKEQGYTVKYSFYRGTASGSRVAYRAALTKKTAVYINTVGKAGQRYYYKARIRIYDRNGKLAAQTGLGQCRYAKRIWTK